MNTPQKSLLKIVFGDFNIENSNAFWNSFVDHAI